MEQFLFGSDLWKPALEKYAEVTGLSVALFDFEGCVVLSPEPGTPLFAFFREYGVDPGLFADCARGCLQHGTTRPAVTVAERHGLTVIGTSLVLEGAIVGAAVAGYALAEFSQVAATQRWAASIRVPFDRLWQIVRQQAPVPERRLQLHGELLQVLGDALLRENYHTRQSEDLVAQLRAAAAAKDQFLALLGHELRNPLSAVRNAIVTARLDEKRRDHALEIAGRQSEHLSRLVDDLLDVARITQGKIRLRREHVALDDPLERAAEGVRSVIAERGQTLSISGSELLVDADPARLEQIIGNLLSNAAKYTPPGGRIEVVVEREGTEAVVRVRDNGSGIAPDVLPHIFDLFTQGDTQLDRAQGGLGIGLTVVQRLVELHGGHVEAHSAGPGRGAEFIVGLPALPAGEAQTMVPPRARGGLSGVHVLVVEDNPDAAEALKMLLELHRHRVCVAHDGPEALDAVRAEVPAIALVDIGLPGMDGYELVRRLRQQPSLERTTLVALSGYGRDEDKARALAAGFHFHLTKPLDAERLEALMGQLAAFAPGS